MIANSLGIVAVFVVAYMLSQNRTAINPWYVIRLFGIECVFALLSLKTSFGLWVLSQATAVIGVLSTSADKGISFLFGKLAQQQESWGFIFAVKVLPMFIFISALMSVLYYIQIIPYTLRALRFLLQPILGSNQMRLMGVLATTFLGQTEATFVIDQYLKKMSRTDVITIMITGMGSLSLALIAVYSSMGISARHLITANMMAIPGTLLIAHVLFPLKDLAQDAVEKVSGAQEDDMLEHNKTSFFDALAQGINTGLRVALAVGAMLLAFLSLIALANTILATITSWFGYDHITFEKLVGYILWPVGWMLGLPGKEGLVASELLGIKLITNEMVGYTQLLAQHGLSERTITLVTYLLAGFANIPSIGVLLGSIGTISAEHRKTVVTYGVYALIGGQLSSLLSACLVGLLL